MRVGLGVGLGVGVPLLAALGAVAVLLGRERRSSGELRKQAGKMSSGGDEKAVDGGWSGHSNDDTRNEMPGGDRINEMAGTDGREELSGVRL